MTDLLADMRQGSAWKDCAENGSKAYLKVLTRSQHDGAHFPALPTKKVSPLWSVDLTWIFEMLKHLVSSRREWAGRKTFCEEDAVEVEGRSYRVWNLVGPYCWSNKQQWLLSWRQSGQYQSQGHKTTFWTAKLISLCYSTVKMEIL